MFLDKSKKIRLTLLGIWKVREDNEMKYCFIDESGVASHRDGRLFIVAIVIFDTLDEANSMREKICDLKLRNNIPQDYEFHYSRNAKTKKELFVNFLDKERVTYKSFKAYEEWGEDLLIKIADVIAKYLGKKEKFRIFMDDNPRLYVALRIAFKRNKVTARISQSKSKNDSLIQIADYFAGLASENEH